MYLVSLSLDIYIAGHGFMYLLLPLFVCLMKTKNPDFVSKSGFCLLRVVPPVLLKLNFSQTDFICLVVNILYIKYFQFD